MEVKSNDFRDMSPCEMWSVIEVTDVLEERTASIFRVEE
jgi:hypothetical protein